MVSTLLLSGCGTTGGSTTANKDNTSTQQDTQTTGKKYKIGITQLVEHPALDLAREGFINKLKDDGIDVDIIYKNAQGDITTATTIAQNLMDEKVDLIYAISTPSAQAAKQVTSDVPIVFSAVTDPKASGIEGDNITGVSDKTPVDEQLALFKKLDHNIKKIGILYSTSETNSKIQVEEARRLVSKHGLELVEVGINNINDIINSDALYLYLKAKNGNSVAEKILNLNNMSKVKNYINNKKVDKIDKENLEKNKDNTVYNRILPQTGALPGLLVAFILISIIGSISYFKFKNINK